MKLLIRKEFFDLIEKGDKEFEYRDAHITFICEETKRELRKEVIDVDMIEKSVAEYKTGFKFEDNLTIRFKLKKKFT